MADYTDSYVEAFLADKKKPLSSYETEFNSSDYQPDNFEVGGLAEDILEEITDQQDEWEWFYSIMLFIGIMMIPIQIIFSEDVQPYDAMLISKIQSFYLQEGTVLNYTMFVLKLVFIDIVGSYAFLVSITVFFYLSFDPGFAYKTTFVGICSSIFVFLLKLIIHDPRPYYIFDNIIPYSCNISYSCPSLRLFSGFTFYHYMRFCINKAMNSKDPIVKKNLWFLEKAWVIVTALIVANIISGVLTCMVGNLFFYQLLLTFLYGYMLLRIIIMFNKVIDYYANGARYIISVSNGFTIIMFLSVLTSSMALACIYVLVYSDLYMPTTWIVNLNTVCPGVFHIINNRRTVAKSFLDTSIIYYAFGATIGVNFVVKMMNNPIFWWNTNFCTRIARGLIGFAVNYSLLFCFSTFFEFGIFQDITTDYFIMAIMFSLLGFVAFGLIPILCSYIDLTFDSDLTLKPPNKNQESELPASVKIEIVGEEDEDEVPYQFSAKRN